jgi:hypothetical protein
MIPIGTPFARLIVDGPVEWKKKGKRAYYRCHCTCGNLTPVFVREDKLEEGRIKSCGCLRAETIAAQMAARVQRIELEKSVRAALIQEREAARSKRSNDAQAARADRAQKKKGNFKWDENFRFRVHEWRRAVKKFEAPPDVDIKVTLDTAFTANDTSDRSALVATYSGPYREADNLAELCVLDSRSERWRGDNLAKATVDFCELWKPVQLQIENIPGTEILVASIKKKYEERGITPPCITLITRNVEKGAKNRRIIKLQGFFEPDPPTIRIRYGSHIGPLFEEVENFVPTQGNRSKQINTIDALALAAGFR